MDAHYHLAQKLDTHPMGAPEHDEFLEILRMLFTPQEADLALHLGWKPEPVSTIANKAGVAPNAAQALCESMANKGLVFAYASDASMRYALLPTAPGIFEYPIMIGNLPGVDMERLGQLWIKYYENGWGHELHGAATNMARVLPYEDSIAETVTVLPFEQAAQYIEAADSISLGRCPCRTSKQACDKPIEVCLAFGHAARYMAERKAARLIGKTEAYAVLQLAEKEGLVHCSSNTRDTIDFICNCCPCCCGILGAASRLKDTASRPHSNFYSVIDVNTCTSCALCEDRCPVHAIMMNDVAVVDQALCIGCGLCTSICAFEAITLMRKAEEIPPADHSSLTRRMAREKGRVKGFLANLNAS